MCIRDRRRATPDWGTPPRAAAGARWPTSPRLARLLSAVGRRRSPTSLHSQSHTTQPQAPAPPGPRPSAARSARTRSPAARPATAGAWPTAPGRGTCRAGRWAGPAPVSYTHLAVNSKNWERFTQRARRVLSLAQEEAERLNHSYIGSEHAVSYTHLDVYKRQRRARPGEPWRSRVVPPSTPPRRRPAG